MRIQQLWKKEKIEFQKNTFLESTEDLGNPYRGWYRFFPFRLETDFDAKELQWSLYKDESLVFVQVDISYYRDTDITDEALLHFAHIFTFFKENHKQMILRIVYDTVGKGMEKEPLSVARIQKHMQQLGALIRENAAAIFTLQGIFVGDWGEMHHSKFLSEKQVCLLTDTLDAAIDRSCYLAVRTPRFRRMVLHKSSEDAGLQDAGLQERLGLFNDGMFASATDYGTYGEVTLKDAYNENIYNEAWARADELEYQNKNCAHTPNGGEAVTPGDFNDPLVADWQMEQMHVSYLSSVHDPNVIHKWKTSIWEKQDAFYGKTAFDAIGARLGYRFLVKDCRYVAKKQGYLEIDIANLGYANALVPMECYLAMGEGEWQWAYRVKTDVRAWEAGAITTLQIPMHEIKKQSEHLSNCRVAIYLYCPKANQYVRFANVEKSRESGKKKIKESLELGFLKSGNRQGS